MPKILIVTTIGLTAKAFLLPYAYRYRRLGWQVDLLASDAHGDHELEAGFDHIDEIGWRRTPLAWRNVTAGYKLSKIVASQGYDIVHVHTPVAGFVTRLALRRQRKAGRPQVIYTAHGFHFFKGGRPLRNLLFRTMERLAGPWTDRLVVMNREDLDAAVKYKIVRQGGVCCMPGIGFDPEQYDPDSIPQQPVDAIRAQFGLTEHGTLFLAIAELQSRKRHSDLLHAFSRLQSTTAQLLIAGTGPLLDDLKQLTAQLGIADRVHFLGFRSDVPALIGARVVATVNITLEAFALCNFGSTLGHEAHIGRGSVISPGANVNGGVIIGDGVLIGSGAQILQYLQVGAGASVGAGAVVTHDVPEGVTVIGVPARPQVRTEPCTRPSETTVRH